MCIEVKMTLISELLKQYVNQESDSNQSVKTLLTDLSKQLDVPYSTLDKLFYNSQVPSLKTAEKLSTYFKQPVYLLMEIKGDSMKYISQSGDRYVVQVIRKGKKHTKSFFNLKEAQQYRQIILSDFDDTGYFPKSYQEKLTSLISKRFGRLTVLSITEPQKSDKSNRRLAICQCDCGTVKYIGLSELQKSPGKGATLSCGCLQKEVTKNNFSKGHLKESVEKRIHSQHMRIEPNISNRSTRIRNISYDQSKKLYRVTIVRNGIRYGGKHFKKLGEAQKYKKQLLEDIKKER